MDKGLRVRNSRGRRAVIRLCRWSVISLVFSLAVAVRVGAQDVILLPVAEQQVGQYRVVLRLPADGLFAGAEQQLEFRLTDTSEVDPVLGATAVIRAVAQAEITMPAMPAMPKFAERAHPESVPGDYGLHPSFMHGGEYLLRLQITPPGGVAFTVEFPLKVADEIPPHKPRPKPYQVELQTTPGRIQAGTAARLALTVWANREQRDAAGRPNGKRRLEQVKAFEVMHEKRMHLLIVSRDLNFFAHAHPLEQSDGSFVLPSFIFPTAGDYRLFVDVAPQGAGAQLLPVALKVAGKSSAAPAALAAGGEKLEAVTAAVRVTISDKKAVQAKRTAPFTISFTHVENGAPVTDLQPYLGAQGHLMMIHEDAQSFVHAHPDERQPENGQHGSLVFLVRAPKAGRYRAWVEFQRQGQVNRADFIFEVKEDEAVTR